MGFGVQELARSCGKVWPLPITEGEWRVASNHPEPHATNPRSAHGRPVHSHSCLLSTLSTASKGLGFNVCPNNRGGCSLSSPVWLASRQQKQRLRQRSISAFGSLARLA